MFKQTKTILLICSALLFIGLTHLPIGYYTFLRIAVTVGATAVTLMEYKNGLNFWVIIFGLIAILFNPILPVYLNSKVAWKVIDLTCGIIFMIKAISLRKQ